MGAPAWWSRRRFGLLVSTNLAAVPAWAPIGQDAEWYWAHVDGSLSDTLLHPSPMAETLAHHRDRWGHIGHVDDFVPFMSFADHDPDEWTQLALDAGMGYTVIVAKHHDGWCWWDAPNTERTMVLHGPRRDVVGEYAAACERAGLVFGTSYSLLDWGDPRYPGPAYVEEVLHPHVLDLVERYGSRLLWGDGHWGGGSSRWRSDELITAARAIDPDLVVNDRWWLDDDEVRSHEVHMPDGIEPGPWELRRALGASSGWNRAEGPDHLLTPRGIVGVLTEVVAKGGHLLLSVGPDATGAVPALHAERLRAAGRWVREHRELVERGRPWRVWGDADTRYLTLDDHLHAIDVCGRGRFAALVPRRGRVTRVAAVEPDGSVDVDFEQGDDGLRVVRPRRRDLPAVYAIDVGPTPEPPIELFPATARPEIELAPLLADAAPGSVVQLGDGDYVGPARVPDRVTLRGLGPDRTTIDGGQEHAVVLGAGSRVEHCTISGGGTRLFWLPKPVVRIVGDDAALLGCRIDGHIDVAADRARVKSCHATGLVATGADELVVTRSTFRGMQWDCAIDVTGGSGHLVESCEFTDVLEAIRMTRTLAAVVRANRITARWWGVHLADTETTVVVANGFERTMRAVDIDGGTLVEVTGNAAVDGDSGCVVQRGASDCEIAGNRWERCRVGLLAWDAGEVRHHDNDCVDLGEPDAALVIGP